MPELQSAARKDRNAEGFQPANLAKREAKVSTMMQQ
ncbi:MAG: hypothetical protein RL404_2048, partial [Pseudomonadota bacterium]